MDSSGREKVKTSGGEYTLESILAEYKSRAYIAGEKRLSRDDLARQAESILKEMVGEGGGGEAAAEEKGKEEGVGGREQEGEEAREEAREEAAGQGAEEERTGDREREQREKRRRAEQREEIEKTRVMPELTMVAEGDIKVAPEIKKRRIAKGAVEVEGSEEEEEEVKEYIPSYTRKREQQRTSERGSRTGDVVRTQKRQREEEKRKKASLRAEREYEKKQEKITRMELQREIIREREREKSEREAAYLAMNDDEQEFFGVGKYARANAVEEQAEETRTQIEKEAERRQRWRERREKIVEVTAAAEEEEREEEEYEEPEMSIADAHKVYASGIVSLKRRTLPAFIICVMMMYMVYAPELGLPIPGWAADTRQISLIFISMTLLVMLMGIDVFMTGISDLIRLRAGAETLVSISCIATLLDAVYIYITGDGSRGIPLCTVSASSLLFAMWGIGSGKKGFNRTLKTLANTKNPSVITAEWQKIDEGIVLNKKAGTSAGFISRLTERDFSERTYSKMTPLLIISSLVFSLLATVFKGMSEDFIHTYAAITAVSATFSGLLSYNLPFSVITKRLMGSGAALAGWSGACDVEDAIGMIVKDLDLFPESMVTMNGVKVFSNYTVEKAIGYAGSLILTSESGLSKVFTDLMKEYNCGMLKVEGFACYEGGGIGAVVNGENVLVGSAAFMNLMGVRLSSNLNIKSAVFVAINDELSGVFIINYTPANAVQNALVSLIRSKITPLFAIRDFNITPAMVKTKFKISTQEIEFMTFEERYNLSMEVEEENIKPAAIMSREGLGHFVEIVRAGRQLTAMSRAAVIISALGAVLGNVLMFFICWNRAYESGSAANVLTFMLLWLLPVLLLVRVGTRY